MSVAGVEKFLDQREKYCIMMMEIFIGIIIALNVMLIENESLSTK
jgi:nitrogen fixation protein FixH